MPRCWILIAALLCPACAAGSGPLPPDDGTSSPTSGSPGQPVDDPTSPPDAHPDPGGTSEPGTTTSGDTTHSGTPSSGSSGAGGAGGSSGSGDMNHAGTPPGSTPTPPSAGDPSDIDCAALWAAVDGFGCTLLKLVCNVLEDVNVSGAEVPCNIVVPLACGVSSAAADAAAALCPH